MKVAILGATGPSGLQLVQEALERGHYVTALVRNPGKLGHIENPNLKVETVDIFSEDDLSIHFCECDVVMSCLGTAPSFFGWRTITFYMDTIKSIIGAMRKCGNTRLVTMAAMDTIPQGRGPWIYEWIVRPLILSRTFQSMSEMEDYLQMECSDIEFTVVKPPALTNLPRTGQEVEAAEGHFVDGVTRRMSRRDVVKFMLDCIPLTQWHGKLVSVGVSK